MPQISEKGMAMPSSPIRKLVPFADKAKERGIPLEHRTTGYPDSRCCIAGIKNL